mmetsp:Transcript_103924/g.291045  ORF Transcript_103924/g.291045 Transcript_103924/m.291045 type:complete len:389 (-) Transcript_103924:216-1382(-)
MPATCCTQCFDSGDAENTYSPLSKLTDEKGKTLEGGTVVSKWIRRVCKACCCLVCFIAVLCGIAFILFKVFFGEVGHYVVDAPFPTETCVNLETDLMCTARSYLGECDDPDTPCKLACSKCKPYDAGVFYPKPVPADQVEDYMMYATNESDIPTGLHGIWWMDQGGYSRQLLDDPDYPFDFNMTAETLISFGDAETMYQPETRCVTPVPFYAGQGGHIAFWNNKYGLRQWSTFVETRFNLHFCFTNETETEIHLWQSVRNTGVSNVLKQAMGYADAGGDYLFTPHSLVHMTMIKKPWGWDRVTKVMNDNVRKLLSADNLQAFKELLPESELNIILENAHETVSREYHYPVVQIVDGEGRRTKFYQAYLKYIEKVPTNTPNTQLVAMRS